MTITDEEEERIITGNWTPGQVDTFEKAHRYPATRKPTGPRPKAGRKPNLLEPKRVTIWLESEHIAWIKSQGEFSEVIRRLIEQAKNGTDLLR